MKNLAWQNDKASRRQAILHQFSTQDYLSSSDFYDLIEQASNVPILWYDYTDESIERLHFSVWWGAIARRNSVYQNPVIKDLYLIHELTHFVEHSLYPAGKSFEDWKKTRLGEENGASFASEMKVYNSFPNLRALTFKFPILWDECKDNSEQSQYAYRKLAQSGQLTSLAAQQVEKYNQDNLFWCDLWSDERTKVESWWIDLLDTGDMATHVIRLSSVATDLIPWKEKAQAFKQYLDRSKT